MNVHKHPLGSLLKPRLLGTSPRDADFVSLGWGLRICVSKQLLGDADAAVLGTKLCLA